MTRSLDLQEMQDMRLTAAEAALLATQSPLTRYEIVQAVWLGSVITGPRGA